MQWYRQTIFRICRRIIIRNSFKESKGYEAKFHGAGREDIEKNVREVEDHL